MYMKKKEEYTIKLWDEQMIKGYIFNHDSLFKKSLFEKIQSSTETISDLKESIENVEEEKEKIENE